MSTFMKGDRIVVKGRHPDHSAQQPGLNIHFLEQAGLVKDGVVQPAVIQQVNGDAIQVTLPNSSTPLQVYARDIDEQATAALTQS